MTQSPCQYQPFSAAPVASVQCRRGSFSPSDFRSMLVRHFSGNYDRPLSFVPDRNEPSVFLAISTFVRKQMNDDGMMILMIDGLPREIFVEDGGNEFITLHARRPVPEARQSGISVRLPLSDLVSYGC